MFFVFLSAVSARFFPVLDHKGVTGGLEKEGLGVLAINLSAMKMGYCV